MALQRCIILLLAICAPAAGQEKPSTLPISAEGKSAEITVDNVRAKLQKLEENKDIDPSLKTNLAEIYNKTLESLRVSAEATARAEQYAKSIQAAPELLKSLQQELAQRPADPKLDVTSETTIAQLQQLLSQAETNLGDLQKALAALQDEPKKRADRRTEVPKLADASKAQLVEIEKQLETKPPADENPELTTATRWLLEARKRAIHAELAANQQELLSYEATGEVLTARRDLATRRVAETEKAAKMLRDLVNDRRRIEAEKQTREAQRAAAQAHPAVHEIANTNAAYAKSRQDLAEKIEQASADFEQINKQVTLLDDQFKKLKTRVDTAGPTAAIGLLLRKQRDELPKVSDHRRQIERRAAEIANIHLKLIDYEETRGDLAHEEKHEREVLSRLDESVTDEERVYVEAEIRELLDTQRNYLGVLIGDTNSYLDKLVELDVRQQQLINMVRQYAAYCDERILWIRSTALPQISDIAPLLHAAAWIASPVGWASIGDTLISEAVANPAQGAMFLVVLALLVAAQRPFRTAMRQIAEQTSKSYAVLFLPTVRAFLLTVMLAALWPGVMAYVGLRLTTAENATDFVKAAGQGMQATALVFATLELFRQVCRRDGLGQAHFGWPASTMKLVRVNLWWFMVLGLPLIFVVFTTESQPVETIKNTLGRLAFFGPLLLLALSAHRLMRPAGGLLDTAYSAEPQGWLSRLRYVWHVLAVCSPLALGVLAFVGYYYTSLELAWRMLASLWLIVGLVLAHATLLRWVMVAYRDLALKRAHERRAAAEAKARGTSQLLHASGAPVVDAHLDVKLSDINKQSRRVLQLVLSAGLFVGLWLIWVNVLPALGAMKRIELWTISVPSAVAGANGATTLQPITLANFLLSVVVATITFAASRNLPGLLEIAVLQRLPLDPGGRYAISTVAKYAITVLGVIAAFGSIGIGWSKVQWLVAAISVGLGFGLQEIFANFVSGLILLFERPVRVGDIVSVGDVTGTVSRIRMRATTILDWDMRELVVPNREFVTGRVMNWTLSSKVSRMTVTVGVAFGTDPDRVRQMLLQIADQHPMVLKDPPAHALFDGFGDSTLNFVLRVYMESRDVYLQLRHELHTAIARAFRDADIEIAFPRRDIQIRGVEGTVPIPIWTGLNQGEFPGNGPGRVAPSRSEAS